MVVMDTKIGRIYWTISDDRNFLYFELELPQNYTDHNESYGILKN